MKNRKGFTLVELLAVIVILALIMSIAVISIGGVLNSARQNTFKETAVSIINGVRQQLIVGNELSEGYYIFTKDLLEKGGEKSPLGGDLQIATSISTSTGGNCVGGTKIGDNVCRISSTATAPTCSASQTTSFIRVYKTGTTYTYAICLTAGAGNKFIDSGTSPTANDAGLEVNLLNNNNNSMIK